MICSIPSPCPDTRSKAITDRSYAKIRSGPKDVGKDLRLYQTTPASRRRPPPSGKNIRPTIADFENRGSSVKKNLEPFMGSNTPDQRPGIQADDPLYTTNLVRPTHEEPELEEISEVSESPSQAALDKIQQARNLIHEELSTSATPLPQQASKKQRKTGGSSHVL